MIPRTDEGAEGDETRATRGSTVDLADLAAAQARLRDEFEQERKWQQDWRHNHWAPALTEINLKLAHIEAMLGILPDLHEKTDDLEVEMSGARPKLAMVDGHEVTLRGGVGVKGLEQQLGEIRTEIATRQRMMMFLASFVTPLTTALIITILKMASILK